jgi:phosphate transport system substrate-binding protein
VIQLGKKDNKDEFSKETLLLTSSQAIVEEVSGNEEAIGYLGMGYLSSRTKALQIAKSGEGYPPTIENVLKKTYPLSRGLYAYTDGEPQGIVKLFTDYTLSPAGQKQFAESGFVPVQVSPPAAGSQSSTGGTVARRD